MNHSLVETSRYSSHRRWLLSRTFQYSRTTGRVHQDVSTFQRAMGSTGPASAPEIAIGARPWSSVTSMAVGGTRSRVTALEASNEALAAGPRAGPDCLRLLPASAGRPCDQPELLQRAGLSGRAG